MARRRKITTGSGNHAVVKPEDHKEVATLTKMGYSRGDIANLLDISTKTLDRHFRETMREARLGLIGVAMGTLEDVMQNPDDQKIALDAAKIAINVFQRAQTSPQNGFGSTKLEVNINNNVNENKIKQLQDELNQNTVQLEVDDEGIYHEVDND